MTSTKAAAAPTVSGPSLRGRTLERQLPLLLVVAGVVALVGFVRYADVAPWLVIAAPIATACLWFAAQRPALSLTLMIVAEATNTSGVLSGYADLPVFESSLALGIAALLLAVRNSEIRARLNRWTVAAALLLGCYLASQFLATIGSADTAHSITVLTSAATDSIFVMVVLMLIQVTGGTWIAAAAFVLPIAAISVLTLVNQVFFGGTFSFGGFAQVTHAYGENITTLRYGGPLPDSNFWGRHLVMALPLSAALLTRAARDGTHRQQAAWTAVLLAIVAGIYLTQSRGTFLATAVAVVIFVLACGPTARRWGLFALPIVAVAGLLAPGIGDRLTSAADEIRSSGTDTSVVDPSILGRLASQEMAVLMFTNEPAFGYGPGTFGGFADEYTGQVPTAISPNQAIEAPHNLYLETAAESGVVGLVGWAVLLLGVLSLPLLRLIARPRAPDRVLAAGTCAAILAWSAASVTLHLAYFRTFGIILALAAALAPRPPVTRAVETLLRGAAVWLAAALIGATVAWGVSAATSHPGFTASQRVTVKPVGPVTGDYLYGLELRSRTTLFPTLALILHPTDDDVSVASDGIRGMLTFSSTASTRADAVAAVTQAVHQADEATRVRMGGSYTLAQVYDDVRVEATSTRSTQGQVLRIIAGAAAALLAGLIGQRFFVTRRRRPPTTGSVDHPQLGTTAADIEKVHQ
ncbi:MAG: O-antigen ligase family protein [Gordonia sp. (in: high G+C Gram-positive bacteria)]